MEMSSQLQTWWESHRLKPVALSNGVRIVWTPKWLPRDGFVAAPEVEQSGPLAGWTDEAILQSLGLYPNRLATPEGVVSIVSQVQDQGDSSRYTWPHRQVCFESEVPAIRASFSGRDAVSVERASA